MAADRDRAQPGLASAHRRPDAGSSRAWAGADLPAPEVLTCAGGQLLAFTHRSPTKLDREDASNEDAIAVADHGAAGAALVLCDGVGGHAHGDRASAAATSAVLEVLEAAVAAGGDVPGAALEACDEAGRRVAALPGDAATTLLLVTLHEGRARVHHAGDSQALITGQRGRVRHWTTPHSPVGYAVEAGLLDEGAALVHEDRHLVSNVLHDGSQHVEVGPALALSRRDTLLLASDGLFDNLTLDEVVDHVRCGPLERRVDALLTLASQRMAASGAGPSKPDDLSLLAWRAG